MPSPTIIIHRGIIAPLSSLPPRSVALDGYCAGAEFDLTEQRFSFDHHAGCWRHITKATCQQIADALLLGFEPDGFSVFINDIDADTVLSAWLLLNPKRVTDPQVRQLVEVVGAVDALGPAYPVTAADKPVSDYFHQVVMEPVNAARRARAYATADLRELLDQALATIDSLFAGSRPPVIPPPETRTFAITHSGANNWVMVRSDAFVFDLVYAAGHIRAILWQPLPDGSIAYTVGKKSEFVAHFPVGPSGIPGTILHALSQREAGWGGASTIGGAPRNADGSRSRLTPDEVFAIVETVCVSTVRPPHD
jgi:hypothetical protein